MSRSSQQGFTKGKVCSTNLLPFCNKVTSLVGGGRAVYLDLHKVFDTVSHNVLVDKLAKSGLDK